MPVPLVPIFEVADYQEAIHDAAEVLREGKLLVLPTETVYGAAGLLADPEALTRLKSIRGTDTDTPFTIHLAKAEDADSYLSDTSDLGKRMMRKLWPGPVGIQFDVAPARRAAVAKKLKVAESEIYHDGTITLRCPDHVIATDVIAQVSGPVVLTRAGLDASQISRDLDGKIDLILDAGPSRYSKPSTILRVRDGKYEIVRAGIFDERIIERLLRTTVLFVCSGNTCRSPMAEAIARHILAEKLNVRDAELENKGISVLSAGSFAMPGTPAAAAAVEAVKAMGADLTKHRSRPLSVELIHQADVIYTMSRNHAQAVTALVPSARQKTQTLDPDKDIEDPIGGDASLYKELSIELKRLIEKRLEEAALV